MEMVAMIYQATNGFRSIERFGLFSQLRRAAVSVSSNMAEGKGHYSNRDFVRLLRHARSSLAEIETQILIARQRNDLPQTTATKLTEGLDEPGRIIAGLINSLKKSDGTRD